MGEESTWAVESITRRLDALNPQSGINVTDQTGVSEQTARIAKLMDIECVVHPVASGPDALAHVYNRILRHTVDLILVWVTEMSDHPDIQAVLRDNYDNRKRRTEVTYRAKPKRNYFL